MVECKMISPRRQLSNKCMFLSTNQTRWVSFIWPIKRGYLYLFDVRRALVPQSEATRFVDSGVLSSKQARQMLFQTFHKTEYEQRYSSAINRITRCKQRETKTYGKPFYYLFVWEILILNLKNILLFRRYLSNREILL